MSDKKENPVLRTQGLSKQFGALQATRDVSIDVRAGEIHAVIGPNGAGKSTLINQICGMIAPDAGSVHLGSEDITRWSVQERSRAGIGRTFQISALAMEDTLLQNVMLGVIGAQQKAWQFFKPALAMGEIREKAMSCLERVGLEAKPASLASEVSHGERRQLEVAVALTLAPKVFVMDEPMAGLGAEGSHRMTGFLDALREEAPILLVEHDMDAVFALADRISVLDYGQVIATGTVEQIKANAEVRKAYLGEEA